jgi:hypothetical protein
MLSTVGHAGKTYNTVGYLGEAEYSGTRRKTYNTGGYLGEAEYRGPCREDI